MSSQPLLQGSPEWLALRRTKITATDTPKLLGLSTYQTPLQLWRDKVSGMEAEYTSKMEWGRQNEVFARQAFIEKTGIVVEPEVLVKGLFMASLDGWCPHTKTVVEIKCLQKEDHEAARGGDIAPMYYAQIQHQMMVADSSISYYVGYRKGDIYYFKVPRDEDFIEKIIKEGFEFYRRIQELDPPPATEKDFKHMESEEWKQHTNRIKTLDLQIKNKKKELALLEGEKESLLQSCVEMADGSNACGNGVILEWKSRKGTVDPSLIPGINPDDFRRPTTYKWTIKLEGEK